MDIQTDVVVVGAGGGGAILGLILAKQGIKTLVVEQSPGPPTGLRGEILQPNGQQILDQLELLDKLPKEAVQSVRHFHFRQMGGERLCTIDYDLLPPPYNRALVTLPNAVHHAVLAELEKHNPGGLWYDTSFKSLVKTGNTVTGVEAQTQGTPVRISAKVTVGADGPFSRVRDTLGISTQLHRYKESYLISILPCPEKLEESQYFLGENEILGVFPAAGHQVYVFYMIASNSLQAVKQEGIESLQRKWKAIYPGLARTFENLQSWEQTAYMGTGRARAKTWVADGAVLIGDAAHGMNPHASQGRMQAMADAVVLAKVLSSCFSQDDFTANALKTFEAQRRPQVEMLQRLADEEVLFWNTGNPLLAWLRNRVFSTLDHNRRLQYQVLTATAGLRKTPPFGMIDRLQAAGFLPDPRANQLPSQAGFH
ncbi:FAD-dependent monooxygenase [Candidatus Nitronereus thalassa]|uniref:FAD-dependent monooxygenase n=1 Tax=Candidatus Nitronereus thalassa TaxID=3020898 RepID=A0ABU3K456_9BACT|nr:FAD-dependent monooxygenase [Candidatus Nitronereus thalassa]MDT7041163.1 FAD-dependent monooxygenase [Candidatus Nitronereus thalassa]